MHQRHSPLNKIWGMPGPLGFVAIMSAVPEKTPEIITYVCKC